MTSSKGDMSGNYYDEYGVWPELKYLPNGKVKAKRWWWLPDRKKAKLLTIMLNSDTFKKARFLHTASAPNPFYKPPQKPKEKRGNT